MIPSSSRRSPARRQLFGRPERPAPEARRRVEVPLGARAYSILIGPGVLDEAGAEIARIAPGANCAVVTDANVAPLYLDAAHASLERAGLRSTLDRLPARAKPRNPMRNSPASPTR